MVCWHRLPVVAATEDRDRDRGPEVSSREINELIWTAFTDSDFCARLLNGQRHEMLAAANLTRAEQQAALTAEADTLAAFARIFSMSEKHKTLMP